MKPRSEAATKEEKRRYAELKSLGCIACRLMGRYGQVCGPTEIQHLTSGGRRISNFDTIPLGRWHHQGIIPPGYKLKNSTEATEMFGPSFAKSKREFEKRFGAEEELLAETNRQLGIKPDPWKGYDERLRGLAGISTKSG